MKYVSKYCIIVSSSGINSGGIRIFKSGPDVAGSVCLYSSSSSKAGSSAKVLFLFLLFRYGARLH